jgi:transcriptional regulator with XRE-family HTH domain
VTKREAKRPLGDLTFHAHIAKMRSIQGMSRLDLALEAKCSEEYVRLIEKGNALPSIPVTRRLMKALELTPREKRVAWVLWAERHLPEEVRPMVEVHPAGATDRAVDAAVEWAEKWLDIPVKEVPFLRSHVEQRMSP